jgi:hypothetical protein
VGGGGGYQGRNDGKIDIKEERTERRKKVREGRQGRKSVTVVDDRWMAANGGGVPCRCRSNAAPPSRKCDSNAAGTTC